MKSFIKFHVAFTLMIIATAFVAMCGGCRYDNKTPAEHEADVYLTQMYPDQPHHVSCMSVDTDHNGYVSCDAHVGASASTNLIPLECGATAACWDIIETCNTGCKLRPLVQFTQPPPQ